MRTLSIILLSLFLFSCSAQYSVKSEIDKYQSTTNTYEQNNYVSKDAMNSNGILFLNLFKQLEQDSEKLYIRYETKTYNWLFVEKNECIQILLTNGEVIKLSSIEEPVRKTEPAFGCSEKGIISIDKIVFEKLISNPIESIRVYGDNSYIEFGHYVDRLQQRWKEFSNTHLTDFLN